MVAVIQADTIEGSVSTMYAATVMEKSREYIGSRAIIEQRSEQIYDVAPESNLCA
jgi:hypothetical protein